MRRALAPSELTFVSCAVQLRMYTKVQVCRATSMVDRDPLARERRRLAGLTLTAAARVAPNAQGTLPVGCRLAGAKTVTE